MRFFTLIQNVVAATALACMVVPTYAQNTRTISRGNVVISQAKKFGLPQKKAKFSAPARFVTINPADYGTVEVVMEEDFSKFATGSEEAPDLETNVILDWTAGECEYPWWNVDPQYTNIPHWGGANLFPAGGKVYMLESLIDGPGHISTPLLDFTKFDGGVAFIEFKARTKNPNIVQQLMVEAAETHDMAPDWTVLGSEMTEPLTEDWKTYTVMFYGAGATSLFNIVPQMEPWWYQDKSEEPCEVLFDDFKIYSVNQNIAIPKNLTHKNYAGEEFDLVWDAQDADSYIVDVYEIDVKTGDMYEFQSGLKAETNSLHITGAEAGTDYMFFVTACKGDKKSFRSLPGFVIDITDPEFTGTLEYVQDEETGGYLLTSEWSDVPAAECYDYSLLHKRPAVSDGLFAVTDEDFTGIQDYDGNTTEWTIENPDFHCYGFLPLKPFKQAGWVGKSVMPFKDFIAIDGWQKIIGGNEAYIVSPELDLSKDNGKVNVSLKLFGRIAGEWQDPVTKEVHPEAQVKAAVSLYNYDEATGSYVQAECQRLDDVTIAWNAFDVELTKGSERSYIVIEPIEGSDHLYVDDILITQNYKKGEYLLEPCYCEFWYTYSIIDVELPENSQGLDLVEKVTAQRMNPVEGKAIFSNSAMREDGKIGEIPAGIQNAAVEEGRLVSFDNGMLNINNANGELVKVSTIDGKLVATSYDRTVSMNITGNTVYIVTVGNKSVKVTM